MLKYAGMKSLAHELSQPRQESKPEWQPRELIRSVLLMVFGACVGARLFAGYAHSPLEPTMGNIMTISALVLFIFSWLNRKYPKRTKPE